MSCRKPIWLIPLMAVAFWLPTRSVQAQIFSGSTQSRMMGRAGEGPNYFAIMGHIKYPQTYLLPTSAPFLADFIRFAGGALDSTTGEVRIVRGGRVVQQTTLIANSTIKLMPGDLVILDGGRSGRGKIFLGGSNRQNRNADTESGRLKQICLIGVRPYPIIMQMTPEVATKRWVVNQLGHEAAIANSAKVIERRRFSGPSGIDTRLSDNSVLMFPPGVIDPARLPTLPRPFRAGTDRHPDQKPLAGPSPNRNQGSAAAEIPLPVTQPLPAGDPEASRNATAPADSATRPGYSEVPNARDSAESIGPDPDTTRNLLTHPASVPLDEKPTTLPSRARLSDSGTASTGRSGTARLQQDTTGSVPRESSDSEIRFNADVVRDAEAAASRPAEKPFQSQPDPGLTPVLPESSPPAAETSALPLTPLAPVREPLEAPAATSPVQLLDPPQQEQSPLPGPVETPAISSPPVRAEEPVPAGPSMALNGAAGFANPPRRPVTQPGNATQAGIKEEPATEQPVAEPTDTSGTPQFTEASIQSLPRQNDSVPAGEDAPVIGKGRVVPHEKGESSWPLITAGVIGSLGFLAAFSLLLSMTGPAPTTPAPAQKSDRYWLDKIINDELPVTEEPAAEPMVSELFGRPTDAPTLRLDAGHSEIPRPHFLDRGRQTGVGQRRSPQPDMPQPDSKRPDGEDENQPTTMPPRRTGSPGRGPEVPLAPAAEQQSGSAVAERPADASKTKRRIVQVDSGHGSGVPTKSQPESAPKIAVKPAESVAAGSDLLDRILASVEFEKTRTPKKHPSQKDPS